MLKSGYVGVYHQFSNKHLHKYVDEFAGRHNLRTLGTINQLAKIIANTEGKLLKCRELIYAPTSQNSLNR